MLAELAGPRLTSTRNPVGFGRDERTELAELRHRNRVLAMGLEILKRASAVPARENVLQ